MRAQIGVDVVPIFIVHVQSLLQQNNIGVTYVGTSNFIMELIIFVPLYFVAMPQSIITIIEVKRVEVYYEILLKLANSLQHKTTNSFLTTVFKFGLQPYLRVAIASMKRKTLQQHKEKALVCEEGISEVEAISSVSVPQSNKTISTQKPQTILEKIRMYCTNCHRTNHNVETCRVKRKENHVPTIFEVIIQQIKVQRLVRYFCHICGDIGHKIIDCPKYDDMQNMFKNKGVKPIEK